jgi:hypothetical protein
MVYSMSKVVCFYVHQAWLKMKNIKPIILRPQRGYINHGTLYYTNLTHTYTHTHIYIHTDTSFTLIIGSSGLVEDEKYFL